MKNKFLPVTLRNNTLTFENVNLIKEAIFKVDISDRTKNMELLLKELFVMIEEMSVDTDSNIKIGDTVRANKSYHQRKYNTWHGELFKVIGIRPHKKFGIGYRIKCIDGRVFSQFDAFYVSRSAIVKVDVGTTDLALDY